MTTSFKSNNASTGKKKKRITIFMERSLQWTSHCWNCVVFVWTQQWQEAALQKILSISFHSISIRLLLQRNWLLRPHIVKTRDSRDYKWWNTGVSRKGLIGLIKKKTLLGIFSCKPNTSWFFGWLVGFFPYSFFFPLRFRRVFLKVTVAWGTWTAYSLRRIYPRQRN